MRKLWTIFISALLIISVLSVIGLTIYQHSIQQALISRYTDVGWPKIEVKIEPQEIEGQVPEWHGETADNSDLISTMKKAGVYDDERLTGVSGLKILRKLNPRKDGVSYRIGEEINLPAEVPEVCWPL